MLTVEKQLQTVSAHADVLGKTKKNLRYLIDAWMPKTPNAGDTNDTVHHNTATRTWSYLFELDSLVALLCNIYPELYCFTNTLEEKRYVEVDILLKNNKFSEQGGVTNITASVVEKTEFPKNLSTLASKYASWSLEFYRMLGLAAETTKLRVQVSELQMKVR